MQRRFRCPVQTKKEMVAEVIMGCRTIVVARRYGLSPEDLDAAVKEKIQKDLSQVIRVNARPLTIKEWTQLLEEHGFEVESVRTAPMHLLRPKRMLEDEGLRGLLKIVYNVIRNPQARRRVLAMRREFLKYSDHLQAVSIIARVHG